MSRRAAGIEIGLRGEMALTRELFWLSLTVILTGVLWIPYILNRCQIRGLGGAMANPSRNAKPHAEWANRLMFAHDNAIENLVIFAPLVLILNAIDYSSKWTVLACAVYFWARVAHLIVYTLGLPVFRTLAFTVGFIAQAVLALAIFKIVCSLVSRTRCSAASRCSAEPGPTARFP